MACSWRLDCNGSHHCIYSSGSCWSSDRAFLLKRSRIDAQLPRFCQALPTSFRQSFSLSAIALLITLPSPTQVLSFSRYGRGLNSLIDMFGEERPKHGCEPISQAPGEQGLDDFRQDLLGGLAPSEVDILPESPTSRRLREEAELMRRAPTCSADPSQQEQATGARQFYRPQSNGKDGTSYQFTKAPATLNRAAAEPYRAGVPSFAPRGYLKQDHIAHEQKRPSSEPPGGAAVCEARVRESIEGGQEDTYYQDLR